MGGSNAMDELQPTEDQANGWSMSETRDHWKTNGEVKYGTLTLAYIDENKLIKSSHLGEKHRSIRTKYDIIYFRYDYMAQTQVFER